MLNKISRSPVDREKLENTAHTHPEDTNIMRKTVQLLLFYKLMI